MGLRQSIGIRRPAILLVALFVLTLVCAPRAEAFVYWADYNGGAIGRATLDGTGIDKRFITKANAPAGVAVDEAHVYWSSTSADAIGRANLDGTGIDRSFITGAEVPVAVSVDSAHIHWANDGASDTIGRANLDGTGVNQSFISVNGERCGVTSDDEHVYWSNPSPEPGPDTIGRANLDGTGIDQSFIITADSPCGIVTDNAHIYWAHIDNDTIGRANLNGTGINQSFIGGLSSPAGVAVDDAHLYWTNLYEGTIGRANLDGTGIDQSFISASDESTPSFLRGVAVDALQPRNEFSLGKVRRNRRRGTAKLTVEVPGPGDLALAKTKRVKRDETRADGAGTEVLRIRSRRKARRHLNAKGKARVKAWVTYTPHGGEPNTQSKRLKLIKRR